SSCPQVSLPSRNLTRQYARRASPAVAIWHCSSVRALIRPHRKTAISRPSLTCDRYSIVKLVYPIIRWVLVLQLRQSRVARASWKSTSPCVGPMEESTAHSRLSQPSSHYSLRSLNARGDLWAESFTAQLKLRRSLWSFVARSTSRRI